MFWDIKQTLSYNALFNFIVGNRGSGKSYGAKKFCIEDFLNNGNEFVWVRRFDSEFDDFKTAFFSDILDEFPEVKLEYTGYKFYINDKVAGYAIPLSISAKKKSSSYPKVNKIIFDEFIIDKGNSYYLKQEVQVFLDLCETTFRMRDNVKGVFFIANAITFTNPYFIYFKINKPTSKKGILRQGEILIQLVNNEEYIKKKKQTRFGKLIEGTDYGNYSINNNFLRDNDDFIIQDKPKDLKYYFTIKSGSENYGVWLSYDLGLILVSKKFDPSYKIVYTTMLENHKPNTMLLKGGGKSHLFNMFIKEFKMGNVYFDSIKTKNMVLETIKNTL